MALEDLLAGLEAEAAAETASLEAETREEAERIVETAQAEAHVLREQTVRAGEAELLREGEQRRALARLAAAAMVREAREDGFREFLLEVRARLDTLRESSGYAATLRALIRESRTALPSATTLHVDPRDELLATNLLVELGLEMELDLAAVLETAGGVELTSGDGRTVRNTVEERLANATPSLRLLYGETLRGVS